MIFVCACPRMSAVNKERIGEKTQMINGIKRQVDKLWTEFWTGGITNPLMVIEQISFLMFARLLDIRETT